MNATPEQLLANFKYNAEVYFARNKFEDDESKFRQACDALKATQFQAFRGIRNLGVMEVYIGQKLETDMNSIFAYLVTQQKLRIQGFINAAEALLNETVKNYEGEFLDLTRGGGMNEAGLRRIHSLQVTSILEQFSRDNPFPQGDSKCRASGIRLKQALQEVLEKFVREVRDPHELAKLQSLQYYNIGMENVFQGVAFIYDDKLQTEHARLQQEAITRFENCLQHDTPVNADEMKKEIRIRINKSFETFKSSNDQKLQKASGGAEKAVQYSKEEYDRIMTTNFGQFTKEVELEACHDREKAKLLSSLQQIFSRCDTSFTQQFEKKLEDGIEERYEELREALARKSNEKAIISKILKQATSKYHGEMGKRFNSSELFNAENLLGIHNQAKELIIKYLKGTNQLSRAQWEGVGKELDALLPGYMRKDTPHHTTPPQDNSTPTDVNLTPGAPPPMSGFPQGPPPPPMSGFPQGPPPPPMSGFPQGPPPPPMSGFPQGPPPPPMSGFPQGPPPPQMSGFPQGPPPPPMSGFPQGPPPPQMSGFAQDPPPPTPPQYPPIAQKPSVPPFPPQAPSSPPINDLTQGAGAPPAARPSSTPVAAARSPTKTAAPQDLAGAQMPVSEPPKTVGMGGPTFIDLIKAGVTLRKTPAKDGTPQPNDLGSIMKSEIDKISPAIRGNEKDEDTGSEDDDEWK